MAVFKLTAPPRFRMGASFGIDGVFNSGGQTALAGAATARAVGAAALLRGVNLAGAGNAGAQAVAALLKGLRLQGAGVGRAAGYAVLTGGTLAEPSWIATVPDIEFDQGVASSHSLLQYTENFNAALNRFAVASGTLTDGITLDPVFGYYYDGDGAVGGLGDVTIEIQDIDFVDFSLTSPTTKANAPWAFGHAFKQGDVPSGYSVGADGEAMQATIKNTWPDGSAKFAILAGRKSLTGGIAATIGLTRVSASGSDIALSALQALIVNNANTVDLGAYGVCDLHDAISATSTYTAGNTGNKKWSAGLIRQWIAGPQMSEWHFYTPAPSDDHLAVFWQVRLWAGNEVSIVAVVENGWLNVASPTVKSYTPVVTINGTQRAAIGALTHQHHTRWSRQYWFDATMPEVVPQHDVAYLRSTKLVPNYGWTAATSAAFNNNAAVDSWAAILNDANPAPLSNGTAFGEGGEMGDYGYDESIGLLPRWEALYCTTGDARAFRATVGNARCYGTFGMHYRDETTLRPLRFSSYPNLVMNGTLCAWKSQYGPGSSSTGSYTPTPVSGVGRQFAGSHHHLPGYLAYLLTGEYTFLEQTQLIAMANFLSITNGGVSWEHRGFSNGHLVGMRRFGAWSMRTLGAAATMTPASGDAPDTALRTELLTSYAANCTYFHDRWVDPAGAMYNTIGLYWRDEDHVVNGGLAAALWESDFTFMSLGFMRDIGVELSGTAETKRNAFMTWLGQSVVGRLGTTDFDYTHAAQYTHRIAATTDEATLYTSWAQVFTGTFGANNYAAGRPLVTDDNDTPLTADGIDSNYWGNIQPAIALAVDYGISGAAAARARMTGASNWTTCSAAFNNNPLWGVVPR